MHFVGMLLSRMLGILDAQEASVTESGAQQQCWEPHMSLRLRIVPNVF